MSVTTPMMFLPASSCLAGLWIVAIAANEGTMKFDGQIIGNHETDALVVKAARRFVRSLIELTHLLLKRFIFFILNVKIHYGHLLLLSDNLLLTRSSIMFDG